MPVDNGIYYSLSENSPKSSTPLVLIHGAGGSHLGWHSNLRRLPGMKVIAPDLSGHGKSKGTGRQSILDYARDVLDFMHALKLPGVILAGHSMGGAIALQAALMAPERISGLIVVSSAAICTIPEDVVYGLSNPNSRENTINWLCERLKSPAGGQKWVEQTRMALQNTRQGILFGDLYACLNFNLEEECPNVRIPSLVCTGSQDRFIPPALSRRLAKSIPDAKYEVLDAGHLLPLEKPEELVDVFEKFLVSMNRH